MEGKHNRTPYSEDRWPVPGTDELSSISSSQSDSSPALQWCPSPLPVLAYFSNTPGNPGFAAPPEAFRGLWLLLQFLYGYFRAWGFKGTSEREESLQEGLAREDNVIRVTWKQSRALTERARGPQEERSVGYQGESEQRIPKYTKLI